MDLQWNQTALKYSSLDYTTMAYEDYWCMGLLPILLVEDCKSNTNLTAQNKKVVGVEKYCQIVR